MKENKIYVSRDGNRVVLGKPFSVTVKGLNYTKYINSNCLDENLLKELIEFGYVSEVKEKKVVLKTYEEYVQKLKTKWGVNTDTLDVIVEKSPASVFSALLKMIAIDLDKKYTNHINEVSDYLYIVSITSGLIKKINACDVQRYEYVSLFRTERDASDAVNVLAPLYKAMFCEF